MRDALKSFYFRKKKADARKGIFFYFVKLPWKHFFMKEFKWRIFYKSQFRRFRDENRVFSVQTLSEQKPIWLVDDFSQCTITLLSFCLFHCNTGTLKKQSFFNPDFP